MMAVALTAMVATANAQDKQAPKTKSATTVTGKDAKTPAPAKMTKQTSPKENAKAGKAEDTKKATK